MSNVITVSHDQAKQLIREYEGYRSQVYDDNDAPAIGYGHRILPDDPRRDKISLHEAEALLESDLQSRARFLSGIVQAPLSENQFNALLDLLYNIGAGAFKGSTLLELLNKGDYQGAGQEIVKWHHVNQVDNARLMQRRQAEYRLFMGEAMGDTIDKACPWVEVDRFAGSGSYWKLTDFWYVPPSQVGNGPANIYFIAYNADGTPAWSAKAHVLNGGDAPLSFKENSAHQAEANGNMSRDGIFYPDRGQRGPYSARMDGNSDALTGLGLPVGGHAQYWGVWKWVETATPPPPVTPPSDYVTRGEFESLQAECRGLKNLVYQCFLVAADKALGG